MCHPDCSIARDEVIAGSDIDGGLVILAEPVDTDTAIRFVRELRRQGFSAYHQAEIDAADAESRAAIASQGLTPAQIMDSLGSVIEMAAALIGFRTQSDIEASLNAGILDSDAYVYLAGVPVAQSP